MEYFLELFLSGLTRGSIYALIALGYTMVYGIIQLINFAHGEIYMIGAFVALVVSGVMTIYGFSGVSILIPAGTDRHYLLCRLRLHPGKNCLPAIAGHTPTDAFDQCDRYVSFPPELRSAFSNR